MFISICLIWAGCSGPGDIAGSISETGNAKVAGIITDASGAVSADAAVFLVPSDYIPVDSSDFHGVFQTQTDESGRFSFEGLDAGIFTIEAYNEGRSEGAMERDVVISSSEKNMDDADLRLEETARITVSLHNLSEAKSKIVYIPGTTVKTGYDADKNDSSKVVLKGVPAGIYQEIYSISSDDMQRVKLNSEDVNCRAGTNTIVDPQDAWKYSRKIVINTSASGADISEDVSNFPLLVRLNENVFDFTLARERGEDLRFTDRNDNMLACEMEFWSDTSALLWVRVPVILGNNTEQFITMKWGNPDAEASGEAGAVFDTAQGFGCVLHLNEKDGDVYDATANKNDGTDEGTQSTNGMIGRARDFDSSRIDLGNSSSICSLQDSITVSGWIKTAQIPDTTVSVIRSHEHFTALQFDSTHAWTAFFNRDSSYSVVSFDWKENFTDGKWHYLTTKFKAGQGCRVFLDSVLLGENIVDADRLNNISQGFLLGGTESYDEYFRGVLDEVRVERAYRSDDWIRLCYMNQKEGSNVVSFE